MKNLNALSLYLIIFLMAFPFFSNTSAAQSTSPIGYWKFDEGNGTVAFDSSGLNNQGTIHGASWTTGKFGGALSFNGASDYVSLPSISFSNADSVSVVAWVNSNFSQIGYVFYNGNTGEFLLHNGERPSDGPVSGRYPNLASFSVHISWTWYDVYSSPLTPNVWHQIVGVWTKECH